MKSLKLVIERPTERLERDGIELIELPTRDGFVGILPGHAFMFFALKQGQIRVKPTGEVFEIEGGLSEVKENCCTILATI